METRKVQVTGGSTYTVSLPKSWATDNEIEAGSVVEFYPEDDSLLLTPQGDEERTEGQLDITDLAEAELMRSVVTMYVSGFDIITLTSTRITAAQRRAIRQAAQRLVGLEVIGETSEKVSLQDLLDSSELSVSNAITRMRLVSLSMLSDAVTALIENDDDLATDVIERDDDVDRLWYMVSRVFRSVLRNPNAATEVGLPRETCFDYHSSARQLERVGDHATKIAEFVLELDDVPENAADGMLDLRSEASSAIEMAMEALLEEDATTATELGNEAREHVQEIDSLARQVDDIIRDLDPQPAQLLGLIVDSLSRSADYGGNIAETALQNAAPKP
ncbi:phosphate signaling complex PhoU family protein [Halocatena pleomorpha]|uniref:Phosphate uptake regulator PhoU n=1 Tax=Halocatena pleomorpha TaxID=1785090 RepID=A0A3P3RAR0_9EURY|nr:phosphate uptake regulator PhoU [Halocatena pleomorpha]RRJ29770.1 phosphate uptake regulator PhoU [Halocatena pleomorpha]